jgi:glycosyltransferase involved in cell wall biosynthesis
MNMQDITFVTKTIARAKCVARLVSSVLDLDKDAKIIVVDDGKPKDRFSAHHPELAKKVTLIETEHDIGISAGRNIGFDAVETEYAVLSDDDHVFRDKRFSMPWCMDVLKKYDLDFLAFQHSGAPGIPRRFNAVGDVLRMERGALRWEEGHQVAFCNMIRNLFLCKTDTVKKVRWDPALKVHEHWDFFYRGYKDHGVTAALAMQQFVWHQRPGSSPNYRKYRVRKRFSHMAMRKHGFKCIKWV